MKSANNSTWMVAAIMSWSLISWVSTALHAEEDFFKRSTPEKEGVSANAHRYNPMSMTRGNPRPCFA